MWFDPRPGTVNSIGPGKRIVWAGTPTLVLREGRPFMALGAPGGRRIISAVAQVITNVVDFGMGMQAAVAAPRVHCEGPQTDVDALVGDEVIDSLRSLGHEVIVREETFSTSHFARPNGVLVDATTGELRGGVNQYKPALAIGL
jgi:gamma-glutamyltranspeptidase / glutathione hydrolase